MTRPRVAYMLYDFHISGMASWIALLAERLRDEFDFHFIATRVPQIAARFRALGRAVCLPEEGRALVGYLRAERIDLVQYANARFFGECALAAGVPVVVERTDGLRGGEALQPKEDLDAVIASAAGTIGPISRLIARERIHLIYNGVDAAFFGTVAPDRAGFGPGDVVIGRSTRFGRGKNLPLLIEAVRRLGLPQAALVIVGSDSHLPLAERLADELKRLAAPLGARCVFTGAVEDPRALIRGFDIGTCTSRADNEGIPNSLLEPMAAGRPVVTTDTGDVRELVEDGVEGFVVPDGDAAAFADRLRLLVERPDLRERMGRAARAKVLAKFDLGRQAAAYRDLYHRLLEGRRRGLSALARTARYRLRLWRAFVPRRRAEVPS